MHDTPPPVHQDNCYPPLRWTSFCHLLRLDPHHNHHHQVIVKPIGWWLGDDLRHHKVVP